MIGRLRLAELGQLIPAGVIALAGASVLVLREGAELTTLALAPAIAILGLFVLAHWWLVARQPAADQSLLPLAAAMTALGLTVVTRIEPELGPRQLMWLAIALLAWAGVIAFPRPVGWIARYRYTWALLAAALLASTMVFGIDPNQSGVRVWLGVAGYYFQPSELIKVLLVAFLAAYLDETRHMIGGGGVGGLRGTWLAYLLPLAAMCGISLGLLVVQRDLGPAVLFFAVTLAMLYLATGRVMYVLGGTAAFVGLAAAAYQVVTVARTRVDIWLDPWSVAADRGYQIIQALVSFANGGVLGRGIGRGHPEVLPAAHTDFPFAVIGEELGLAGTAAVIGLYLLFAMRGYAIATRAPSGFATLLTAGLVTTVSLQTLIIVAGNLKLLPLTGITLPFISYGGSSLVTNYLILGLLHRISSEANERDPVTTPIS